MKRSYKLAAAVAGVLGIALATAAFAHPGAMGAGSDQGMAMMHGGMGAGMGAGMRGGMGAGMRHGGPASGAAQTLMTPEERTALQEKMRAAKTPEERQRLAAATRADMEKRAKDKGVTLPEPHGAHGGPGHDHGASGPNR